MSNFIGLARADDDLGKKWGKPYAERCSPVSIGYLCKEDRAGVVASKNGAPIPSRPHVPQGQRAVLTESSILLSFGQPNEANPVPPTVPALRTSVIAHATQAQAFDQTMGQKWGKPDAKPCHSMPLMHLCKSAEAGVKASKYGLHPQIPPYTPAQSACAHLDIFGS